MQIQNVLETCLYVHDLVAAEAFYREVLGLELYAKVEGRHVFFSLPIGMLLLFKADESLKTPDLPPHGTKGRGHCCFQIDEHSFEKWKLSLEQKGVLITCEYEWSSGVKSLYFDDPSGNVLELASGRLWSKETE